MDSISINQSDNEEKGKQVGEMRNIYSSATQTLIWLGEEENGSSIGLKFATRLSEALYEEADEEGDKKKGIKASLVRLRHDFQFSAVWKPGWKELFALLGRSWFQRAWIIQEICVSEDALMICGDSSILWNDFTRAFAYTMDRHIWVIEFYRNPNVNLLFLLILSKHEISEGTKTRSLNVLARHRIFDATDPRDKVFSFYGLSCHDSLEEAGFVPDYEQTAKSLYLKLATSTIQKTASLDLFSVPRFVRDSELPSWVPDWGCTGPMSFSLLQLEGEENESVTTVYASTKGSKCEFVLDETQTRLRLSGYIVDRITSISRISKPHDENLIYGSVRKQARNFQQDQQIVFDWKECVGFGSRAKYPTGEYVEEAFWQTLIAGWYDIDDNEEDSKENTDKIIRKVAQRQWFLDKLQKLNLHRSIWVWILIAIMRHILRIFIVDPQAAFNMFVGCMLRRKIGMTKNGYMGLFPGIAEVGDYVALFEGGKLPLIIRPNGSDWELIGDSYIHGITKGELWDVEKCNNMWFV